jgi:hypothetical protein
MLHQFKHGVASTEIVQAALFAVATVDARSGARLENPNHAANSTPETPQAAPDTAELATARRTGYTQTAVRRKSKKQAQ